jgi:rSAM/selenodomain-associated transferase 1
MRRALLIFAKNPAYGKVKTRLAATMGHRKALAIYQQLLQHAKKVTAGVNADKFIWYSDFIPDQDGWNDEMYKKQLQTGNDLGEKMGNAFSCAFGKGYEKAAIIGTDCPEITSAVIGDAFRKLEKKDVVIGPSKDGGYYLLASKSFRPELFKNITWSTSKVLQQTLSICEKQQLSVHLLTQLSDVDTESDFRNCMKSFSFDSQSNNDN